MVAQLAVVFAYASLLVLGLDHLIRAWVGPMTHCCPHPGSQLSGTFG